MACAAKRAPALSRAPFIFENILKIFWDAVVGAATTVFKNESRDQLATKIPISGVYTNSNVGVAATIGELLRNAFVRALLPKYDEEVNPGEVTKKLKKGEIPNANQNGEKPVRHLQPDLECIDLRKGARIAPGIDLR